jgi:uncharacterized membrane protein YoaK (UPF0700 family)
MTSSGTGETPDFLEQGPRHEDADTEPREGALTLATFVAAPSQRALRTPMLLLLTLAAGWMDALCYLDLGRVFASFMTGNILFVGLSIAQGNTALLMRAGAAILLFLVSITLGSLYLQALPARQPVGNWRRTLARYLLVEGLILLAFALLWSLAGDPARHPAMHVVLLGIAAFGMGLQGALVGAFNIPDVVSVALTGTELLLGMRLAQRIGRQSTDRLRGTSVLFLLTLMLSYTLAALVVALATPWISAPFIPCLLVAGAVVVVLVTPKGGGGGEGRERP